jgi:hypothetical protein
VAQAGTVQYQAKMTFNSRTSGHDYEAGLVFLADRGDWSQNSGNGFYVVQRSTGLTLYRGAGGTWTYILSDPTLGVRADNESHTYSVRYNPATGLLGVDREDKAGALVYTVPVGQRYASGSYVRLITNWSRVTFDDIWIGQGTKYYSFGSQRLALSGAARCTTCTAMRWAARWRRRTAMAGPTRTTTRCTTPTAPNAGRAWRPCPRTCTLPGNIKMPARGLCSLTHATMTRHWAHSRRLTRSSRTLPIQAVSIGTCIQLTTVLACPPSGRDYASARVCGYALVLMPSSAPARARDFAPALDPAFCHGHGGGT